MANTYKHSVKVKVFVDKEEEALIQASIYKMGGATYTEQPLSVSLWR